MEGERGEGANYMDSKTTHNPVPLRQDRHTGLQRYGS